MEMDIRGIVILPLVLSVVLFVVCKMACAIILPLISGEKPRIGQGRAGIRRQKLPINQTIVQSAEPSKKIPKASKMEKKVINSTRFDNPSAMNK